MTPIFFSVSFFLMAVLGAIGGEQTETAIWTVGIAIALFWSEWKEHITGKGKNDED